MFTLKCHLYSGTVKKWRFDKFQQAKEKYQAFRKESACYAFIYEGGKQVWNS